MKAFSHIKPLNPAIAFATLLAIAAPTSVALADAYKDSDGAVYVTSLPASQPVQFTFTGGTQNKSVVSNACGLLILRGSAAAPLPTEVQVGGSTVNISTLPLGLIPKCNAGVLEIPVTANFKTSTGQAVIIGQTPNTAITVAFAGDRVRKASANACGFVKLKSSASFTVDGTFTVAGGSTSYTVASLETKLPPLCRNGVTYLPQP